MLAGWLAAALSSCRCLGQARIGAPVVVSWALMDEDPAMTTLATTPAPFPPPQPPEPGDETRVRGEANARSDYRAAAGHLCRVDPRPPPPAEPGEPESLTEARGESFRATGLPVVGLGRSRVTLLGRLAAQRSPVVLTPGSPPPPPPPDPDRETESRGEAVGSTPTRPSTPPPPPPDERVEVTKSRGEAVATDVARASGPAPPQAAPAARPQPLRRTSARGADSGGSLMGGQ